MTACQSGHKAQYLTAADTYFKVEDGLSLNLHLDNEADAFVGTIKNVSDQIKEDVSIEVSIIKDERRYQLKPSPILQLAPSDEVNISIPAEGQIFKHWMVVYL